MDASYVLHEHFADDHPHACVSGGCVVVAAGSVNGVITCPQ